MIKTIKSKNFLHFIGVTHNSSKSRRLVKKVVEKNIGATYLLELRPEDARLMILNPKMYSNSEFMPILMNQNHTQYYIDLSYLSFIKQYGQNYKNENTRIQNLSFIACLYQSERLLNEILFNLGIK